MKNYKNTLLSLLAVILAAVGVILAWNDLHRNKQKVEALRTQLAHAQIEPLIQRDTIRDTVPVATSAAIPMERSTYKNELADKQLIKALRLKLGQIEAQQLSGTAIHDTVRLEAKTCSRYEPMGTLHAEHEATRHDACLHGQRLGFDTGLSGI